MVENSRKMAKRKRDERPKKPEEDPSHKMTRKLHHCVKDVRKASKKAKTFELQKLVKKLKGLRAKAGAAEEIAGLEEELEIIKKIDHEPFANTALKTKIRKDKELSKDDLVNAAVAQELSSNLVQPAAPASHLAKVQARLLSSKALGAEVVNAVQVLKDVLHPKTKTLEDEVEVEDEEEVPVPEPRRKKTKVVSSDSDESSGEEGEEDGEQGGVVLSEADDEVDDGGWESGSVHDDAEALANPDDGSQSESGDEQDEDEAEDEDEEQSQAPPRVKPSVSKKATDIVSKGKNAAESTFLPSLAVGFTRGDSDSDWSDEEANVADGVKKNRRGQRARRAIWEKKYGKNANHVKKQQEIAAKDVRTRGRPGFEKGSRNDRPFNKGGNHVPPGTSAAAHSAPPPRPPARERETADDKPLHPSWEAKRKLKEKQSAGIQAPKGKKIVF